MGVIKKMTAPKEVSMDAATEAFLSGLGSIFTVAEEQDKRKEQFFLVCHSTTVFDLFHLRLVSVGGHSSQFRQGGKKIRQVHQIVMEKHCTL